MALGSNIQWEVDKDHANAHADNGGGFLINASGTDLTQSAPIIYTDLVIDATTNTKITSAAFPFSSTSVGSVINVTGGTGFTVKRYRVLSVAAAVATMDSAVGTTSSTGGSGRLGGPTTNILDFDSDVGNAIQFIHLKKASTVYGQGASTNFDQRATVYVIGYETTRGDMGARPTMRATASSVIIMTKPLQVNSGVGAFNVIFDGDGQTASQAVKWDSFAGQRDYFYFCDFVNFTSAPLQVNDGHVDSCYFENNDASSGNIKSAIDSVWNNCTGGISLGSGANSVVDGCAFINALSGSPMVQGVGNCGFIIKNNVFHGNATSGATQDFMSTHSFQSVVMGGVLDNNIFFNISGWGYQMQAGLLRGPVIIRNNSYKDLSSGLATLGSATVSIQANNTLLTADPFTDIANGDFSLNDTAGGGLELRGVSRLMPGGTATTYRDIGAAQHEDAGGGGGGGTLIVIEDD